MLVRAAVPDDLAEIERFDSRETRHERISKAIAAGQAHVLVHEGGVVGYLVVTSEFFGRRFLSLLCVDEQYRNRGFGRDALRWCQGTADGPMFTSTNLSNSHMVHLLRTEGFQESGIIYNLDPGDPEVVFYWHP